MNIQEKILRSDEKTVLLLRSLYEKYGYLPYRMSKFEEYELYIRNKDFLLSDRIISFNDTNGKLLALKPDVTLSIIKSGEDVPGVKQKVYYNENVYRVSESTHRFKEIMQTGLECIGDIDLYDIYEVISLAAETLAGVSEAFVLEISFQDLVSAFLSSAGAGPVFEAEALRFLAAKNRHDLAKLCSRYKVSEEAAARLLLLVETYGDRRQTVSRLREVWSGEMLDRLEALSALLDASPYQDRIKFDFSVVNDMNYYNGFVFRGFVDGICDGVLAGGQYDRMMEKLSRSSGAVGFALYLDLLEQLPQEKSRYDVSVLLLYDASTPPQALAARVSRLVQSGLSVSAQKAVPEKLRYRELIDIRGGKAE